MADIRTKPKDFNIDVVGIGTPKCGTEWLVYYLRKHPQIDFSKHKEPSFFLSKDVCLYDFFFEKMRPTTWEEYTKEFSNGQSKLKMEFTINYIFDRKGLFLLKEAFPSVKIIIALRNPINFLYSHFWYLKQSSMYGKLPDTFEEFLCLKDATRPYGKHTAFFAEKVKFCIELFGVSNTHIILMDDIINSPDTVLSKLCEFLNIDSALMTRDAYILRNPTNMLRFPVIMRFISLFIRVLVFFGFSKQLNTIMHSDSNIRYFYRKILHKSVKYPDMLDTTRRMLMAEFKTDILALEKVINRDLSKWLS